MPLTVTASSVDEVVDYYWRYLARNKFDGHLKRFKDRLSADPKSAEAEAVVFSWLRAEKQQPEIFEDNSKGGPDFRCSPTPQSGFLTEVTSLDSVSLSTKSGLPLKISGAGGGAYALISQKLRTTVQSKAAQLGGQSLPGVLAITSAYDFSGLLMNQMAAQNLLTGDPYFSAPLGGGTPANPAHWETSLRNAIFCRAGLLDAAGNQTFTSCCQSVSAVLLVSIYPHELHALGVLHPDAVRPFDPQLMPGIPFVRFRQWPILQGKIEFEWIQNDGLRDGAVYPHKHIS